jgi:hypothetical protein
MTANDFLAVLGDDQLHYLFSSNQADVTLSYAIRQIVPAISRLRRRLYVRAIC